MQDMTTTEIQTEMQKHRREVTFDQPEPCGDNADWSDPVWHIGPGDANRTSGALYILDRSDTLELVQERFPGDPYYDGDGQNNEVTVLNDFERTTEGVKHLMHYADGAFQMLELDDDGYVIDPAADDSTNHDAPDTGLSP